MKHIPSRGANNGSSAFSPGQIIGRFRVKSVDNLDEYKSRGILFVEELSGAEIYHVDNTDDENLFSFNFTTLPANSTGVAHILEHTVLCGSERYPVRDPFFMLYKGSMQTFLNAMTFPDKTIYPAASPVRKDLFNLMSIYADAVFFPLLRKEHFLQEGHRLEMDAAAGSADAHSADADSTGARIAGIVYNEMKAQYSTQESIARDWTYRSILPDTPYAYDSGGDPAEIPDLSYEEFCAFHRRYYHPSNCRIFLYGNIASEDYLTFLDECIFSRFSEYELKKRSSATVPLQQSWADPRTFEVHYPADKEKNDGTSVDINWLIPEPKSGADIIKMELLSDILFGTPASPIQKLILESELGEDMSDSTGFESDFRQPIFTIGIRGTQAEHAAAVEKLIISGLERVVSEGLDPDLIRASFLRFEFHNREIKGGAPFGLRLLLRTLKRWLHGETPGLAMQFTAHLENLKNRGDQDFFRELIRAILSNPHRSRLTVSPDPQLKAREEQAERELVSRKVQSLGAHAPDILRQTTEMFQKFQQQEDRPEDIAQFPVLTVDDIPRDIRTIPREEGDVQGCPLHIHKIFTNSVSYINVYFDITDMEKELQIFIPFLAHLLPQLGTKTKSYSHMSTEWGLKTGGFSLNPVHHTDLRSTGRAAGQTGLSSGQTVLSTGHADRAAGQRQFICIHLKTLDDMSEDGLALLQEILVSADFSDQHYIREIYREYRNDFRAGIIPHGSSYADIRARRGFSYSAFSDDLWWGVIQSRFIETLHQYAHSRKENADEGGSRAHGNIFLSPAALSALMRMIWSPESLNLSIVCEEQQAPRLRTQLAKFLNALKADRKTDRKTDRNAAGNVDDAPFQKSLTPLSDITRPLLVQDQNYMQRRTDTPTKEGAEGIEYTSKVNFTALAIPASGMNKREQVHEQILSHILRTGIFHDKIRAEGGAYGAFCNSDPLNATFSFATYRDPAISRSWAACADSLNVLASAPLNQADLDLAKIYLAGRELHPLSPAEKGDLSFRRFSCGISDDLRRQRRRWLIESTGTDIQQAAKRLARALPVAHRTVLADPEALNALSSECPNLRRISMQNFAIEYRKTIAAGTSADAPR
ncbi:MAG: insulinase family protein [Salinispira sp.]